MVQDGKVGVPELGPVSTPAPHFPGLAHRPRGVRRKDVLCVCPDEWDKETQGECVCALPLADRCLHVGLRSVLAAKGTRAAATASGIALDPPPLLYTL